MKTMNAKVFSVVASMAMTFTICESMTAQASDIDIYRNADVGETRIMFALDTSMSMDAGQFSYACDAPSGTTLSIQSSSQRTDSSTTPSYKRRSCTGTVTTVTRPKTYKYLVRTFRIDAAQPAKETIYRCGSSATATVNYTYNCSNNTILATAPTGYSCFHQSTDGKTKYYYDRGGCNGNTQTIRYRYRVVTTDAIPETSTAANSCTASATVTCQIDRYSCPEDSTSVQPCTTSVTSFSTTGFTEESCGTGCKSYVIPQQTITESKTFYDRITRLKDGMFSVLQGTSEVPQLGNSIVAGLTRFNGGNSGSGEVVIPARRLDAQSTECGTGKTQRACMLQKIAEMEATNYTPTARTYGVAAKSLLDTINGDTSICNGNGIYFLTDGGPTNLDPSTQMESAISGFTCPANFDDKSLTFEFSSQSGGNSAGNSRDWRCIANFTHQLYMGKKNETNNTIIRPKIKTAVVGFGAFYEGLPAYTGSEKNTDGSLTSTNLDVANITSAIISNANANTQGGASAVDIRNTALWGIYGRAGWYAASQPSEVARSILSFVDEVKPVFDPMVTGTPTIPVDALNPIQLQPYGYYASFIPKPQEKYQLWLGNLNKYNLKDGQLFDATKTISLINQQGLINNLAYGLWGKDGALGKLPLGTLMNGELFTSKRQVFTNREIVGNSALGTTTLNKVNLDTLFKNEGNTLINDPKKNYWLNILGYKVAANANISSVQNLPLQEIRQVGAALHSKPLLITQEGKVVATKTANSNTPTVTSTGREDYILFGSTQGVLHMLDANTGDEIFGFVPHEMMEKQYNGFLDEGNTNLGKDNLFYGIDGAWSSYTQYVSKVDGTLTVKKSDRKDSNNNDLNQSGKQWIFGGLRMGGRSYYGLDITDIKNPSLKFHINPDAHSTDPLSYMGDSWSKPTLAWINWGGTKKQVMFVGGGYDSTGLIQCGDPTRNNPISDTYDLQNRYNNKGYECAKYDQSLTAGTKKGAGVYMFDISNGSLLWWASANATESSDQNTESGVIATKENNLKFSVVSQINAIDRDNDGLADHLYFGDLGGQAFRVDLNNKAAKIGQFPTRVVRLFNGYVANGNSPRFYEMPSVSIHSGVDGLYGTVALSSGNRSSPLAGVHTVRVGDVEQTTTTNTANDGVFVIFDNDVARSDLYKIANIQLRTSSDGAGVSLLNLTSSDLLNGVAQTQLINNVRTYIGGWRYNFSTVAGKYKGMNELYTLDKILYVNVFHKDGAGIAGNCGAGVTGASELYQFCLPSGKCPYYESNNSVPYKAVIGAGILGTSLGQGYTNKEFETGLIITKPTTLDCALDANKNLPECQLFDTGARLKHLRWYENR